jgi:nucleoside-diphosphate-sugar epimerase
MRILITGATGNLGLLLTRYLIPGHYNINLLIHRRDLPADVPAAPNVKVFRADLAKPETLTAACEGVDAVVHFAGVLFKPGPERFLPTTNTTWAAHIVDAALAAGVRKFILVSFPHVEGESTPEHPAPGGFPAANPSSAHARTRLAAERYLVAACEKTSMAPVALRPGMIYGRGVLMIDAARWLMRRRLLAVWRRPTWIHLLALPDWHRCVAAVLAREDARGVYNLGDDGPVTLQEFLDTAAAAWKCHRPPRLPAWTFYVAGAAVELYASVFRTAAPLTRDFIRIGMASYWGDTTRMKRELAVELEYPTLAQGRILL